MLTSRQTDQAWVEMDRERKLAAANRLTWPSFTHVREMGKPWQALGQIVPSSQRYVEQGADGRTLLGLPFRADPSMDPVSFRLEHARNLWGRRYCNCCGGRNV